MCEVAWGIFELFINLYCLLCQYRVVWISG